MLDVAFESAKSILESHMNELHAVAAALLEREKLSGKEFETLMKGGSLQPEHPAEDNAAEKAEEDAVKPAEHPAAPETRAPESAPKAPETVLHYDDE